MGATWRSAGAYCRERGWSKRRLIFELENGLPYRTIPPGWTLDWSDSYLWPYFNVETGEISIPYGVVVCAIAPPPPKTHLGREEVILAIEVLPPGATADADVPSPSAEAPAASPASRRPSDAAVEQCFRDIMGERPDDPLNEPDMLAEMTARLDASPGRQRVRNMWREIAPKWKRPKGHPPG